MNNKNIIKGIVLLVIMLFTAGSMYAQTVKQVMEKCQKALNIKSGLEASFSIEGASIQKSSGKICVKGEKFLATTPVASMWYNGKTMWTYLKQNEEVNVTTPSSAERQRINPYNFLTLYKQGYKTDLKKEGNTYQVHMTKQGAAIPEMYVTINKNTYMPSCVKMKQKKGWITITLSGVKKKSLDDKIFTFNSKDYPKAEVIDLR